MEVNGKYIQNVMGSLERNGDNGDHDWTRNSNKQTEEVKVYTYDEALDLAGTGWYTYGLAAFIVLAFQGMGLDLFGISVVLTGACDFNLTHSQKTILFSMPLLGSIVMAWPWGYTADTQGRRKALAYSLWGSFILSTLSAFSPNWMILAFLKFGSGSLSSGTQSLGFALLGESCSQKFRAPFIIMVSTSLFAIFGVYTVIGYLVLNQHVWFDLGFIVFSSWRLLILLFASPLGLSAVFLPLIFESPKFLLNAGYEAKAVEILKNIMRRNGGNFTEYPVKRIILEETSSLRSPNTPHWQSVRDQTLPLFKPPLLYKTAQLFYVTATIYAAMLRFWWVTCVEWALLKNLCVGGSRGNNGFFTWLPFVLDSFYSGYNNGTTDGSVCDMIVNSNKLNYATETCVGTVKELVLWIGVTQVVVYSIANIGISLLSRWKKWAMIGLMLITFACGMVIPVVTDRMASIVLLNGFLINSLCISIIFSYYVDLIPTSYRAMAACLGVMVARSSSLIGINLVGTYIDSHCITSFYAWSVYVLSGAVVSWFLPLNKPIAQRGQGSHSS